MRYPTANNREFPQIAFFQFCLLDLRSRPYAPPYRLRVVGTAKRKMLENPRREFSLKNLKFLQLQKKSRFYREKTRDAGFPAFSTLLFRPRGAD